MEFKKYRCINHKTIQLVKDFVKVNAKYLICIFRYLSLILLGFIILYILIEHKLSFKEYRDILSIIISTTGVTIAIIVSFLLSKLFSEKEVRVERKRLIDKESHRITAFRKLCHFLRKSSVFWEPFGNLKSKMDSKYKFLTLAHYDSTGIDYIKYTEFLKEVNYGELGGQAYVGLREIEGCESSDLAYIDSQLRKTYSLDEISLIHDASQRIWCFFDKNKSKIVNINSMCKLDLMQIRKNIEIIYPHYNDEELDNSKFIGLFDDIHVNISSKLFTLSQQNEKFLGLRFNLLLGNLLLFVLIIVVGVLLMSINYNGNQKIFDIQVLISIFIVGIIDLIFNVFLVIKKELQIDEFYEMK